jgi:uncharacterized membrane protein YeaQ/YmgE (transglycosylase-associated protein family)
MSDLFVFAVLGLLAGATARLWYPRREPVRVAGTMLLGMTGALLGGLLSWAVWPAVDGRLFFGALLMSLLGAGLALAVWPLVSYARGRGLRREGVA